MIVDAVSIRSLCVRLLARTGVSLPAAERTVDALLIAERWGLPSHGLMRLPLYIDRILAGGINRHASISVLRKADAVMVLSGNGGLGPPQVWEASKIGVELTGALGVSLVALNDTSHSGALGVYVLSALRQSMACIVMCNGPAVIPPWNGNRPVFSTSPIAAGLPGRKEADSVILDLSLSTLTRGQIALAKQHGKVLPEGSAYDSDGLPTTDPDRALTGMLSAIGGVKGSALALLVEALTGGLVGPNLSVDVADPFLAADQRRRQGVAHLIFTFDPTLLSLGPEASERMARLFGLVETVGGRLPGAERLRVLRSPSREIDLDDSTVEMLIAREVR